MKNALFQLRTSIAYFETTGPRLDLEGRMKEMALLCEELRFEPGMLDLSVGEGGAWEVWHPPHQLDVERIEAHRQSVEAGTPFVVAIGPQNEVGVPAAAESMRAVLSTPLLHGYCAEFHTLLQSSGLDRQPWVQWLVMTDQGAAGVKALSSRLLSQLGRVEIPGPTFAAGKVRDHLAHDLATAAAAEMPVVVDPLHESPLGILSSAGGARSERMPGADALRLWAPSFAQLPWSDIIALHDHDAIGEFRTRLEAAEAATATTQDPQERAAALQEIGLDQVVRGLARFVPSWKGTTLDVGVGALIDVIPYAGSIYSALTGVARTADAASDWTAVLLKLRGVGR